MNKHAIGIRTARQLQTVEHALDNTLVETFRLGADMVAGRIASGYAAEVGHQALDDLVAGLSARARARASVVATHSGLLEVAEGQGVRWRMDGPTETKVPNLVPIQGAA